MILHLKRYSLSFLRINYRYAIGIIMKNFKQQSALEFLTTYSWAFIILTLVVAIVYVFAFSVPAPSYLSTSCNIQPLVTCLNAELSGYSANTPITYILVFQNQLGRPIYLPDNAINITTVDLGEEGTHYWHGDCFPNTLNAGGIAVCKAIIKGNLTSSNIAIGTFFNIQYKMCNSEYVCQNATYIINGYSQENIGMAKNYTINIIPYLIRYYVPITLTNSQSSNTPSPFQQMITVNSADYRQYEAGNLDNVEFYYQNGTVIPSWLESGNSNASTNTVYWLKLGKIRADSTLTIDMGFANISTNMFNYSGYTGEAPQLSPIYAEYDDGANVFNFYDNFAGSALNASKWNVSGSLSVTVNNGATFAPGATNGTVYSDSYQIGAGTVIDALMKVQQISTQNNAYYCMSSFGYGSKSVLFATNTNNCDTSGVTAGQSLANYNGIWASSGLSSDQTQQMWSIEYNGSATSIYVNYAKQTQLALNEPVYPLPIGWTVQANSGWEYVVQWIRTRSAPPSGIMPSSSFGATEST